MVAVFALAFLGLAMATRSMLSTARTRRLRRQRRELRGDIGALQSALLPAAPSLAGATVSVAYRPASGPAAGGDFHDILALEDGRIGVIVGDVSGHGRQALASTPLVHYTVRAYLEAGLSPRRALALTDKSLAGKLGDDFATVVAAIYDPATGRLRYATAGHPNPIVTGPACHAIDVLTPPPVGIGPLTGSRETIVPIPPGGRICFFSDGLVEAESAGPSGLLGRDGLARVLAGVSGDDDAETLLERVENVTDGRRDDMTACLLTPEDSPAQGHPVEELELRQGAVADARLEEFLTLCGLTTVQTSEALDAVAANTEHSAAVLRVERDPVGAHWTLIAAEHSAKPALAGIA